MMYIFNLKESNNCISGAVLQHDEGLLQGKKMKTQNMSEENLLHCHSSAIQSCK
jgi:hypothetical protein